MITEYLAALWPAGSPQGATFVLGLRMRPFCLGHHLLLRALDDLLKAHTTQVAPAQPAVRDVQELMISAFVCSQTWEDAKASLESFWFPAMLRFWIWRARHLDFREERQAFLEYYQAGTFTPDTNSSQGRPLVTPWEIRLKVILMRRLHLTESQALNMPLAQAHIEQVALAEMEGAVDLFSKADEELFARARQYEQEDREKGLSA